MSKKDQNRNRHQMKKSKICYRDGRFYFTKESERTFYFILTIIMLAAGVLYKTGIL